MKKLFYLIAIFAFASSVNAQVTVSSPALGDSWEMGTTHNITYNSTANYPNCSFQLYDGVSLAGQINPVSEAIASGNGVYIWDIDTYYSAGNNYHIEIYDDDSGTKIGESDVFELTKPVGVISAVTSPQSGDMWYNGLSVSINWSSSNVDNVKIEYSIDGGTSWSVIENTTSNTNSYSWTVTGISGVNTNSVIRVSDVLELDTNAVSSVFSLLEYPVVFTSPALSTQWAAGSSYDIVLNSAEDYMSGCTVKLFRGISDNGTIASILVMIGQNQENWNISASLTPANNYHLEIFDDTNAKIGESDTFEITQPAGTITNIDNPVGGEYWYNGKSYRIEWTSTNVANVKIEYSIDGGVMWNTIIASAQDTGAYLWNMSGIVGTNTNSVIRVSDTADATTYADSQILTLAESAPVTFSTPNSTTAWQVGTNQNVSIISALNMNIFVHLFKGTSDLGEIINDMANVGTNDFSWSISSSYNPGVDYYLVAFDDNSNNIGQSDTFEITTPAGTITSVDQPVVGNFWYNGGKFQISWTSNYVSNVKIEYSTDNGGNWNTIKSSIANTGTYQWSVSGIVGTNTNSKIRVSDASDASVLAVSATFTLAESLPITFTAPISSTQWAAGSSQVISYTSSANFTGIGLSLFKGGVNNQIAYLGNYNISVGSGTINWDIPVSYVPGTDYYLAFDSGSDTVGKSDNFEILVAPASIIAVQAPGLCNWFNGNTYTIGWTSHDVAKVKIEYSINGGTTWNTIVSSVTNTEAYSWTVSGITGINTNSLVRVSDTADASRFAISKPFTLSENSVLSFSAPTSTTQWTLGSVQSIVVENTGGKIYNYVAEVFKGGSTLSQFIHFSNDTIYPGTNNITWYIDGQVFTAGNDYSLKITDWAIANTTSETFELVTSSGTPTITTSVSSLDFGNLVVGHTIDTMISIAATDLTGNLSLSVTVGSGFLISNNGSAYTSSLTFTPNKAGGMWYVWIQYAPTTVSSYSDDLTIESYGATTKTIVLAGNSVAGINDIVMNDVSVYPNPSNGIFNIETDNKSGNDNILIFDISGKLIYSQISDDNITNIDLLDMPEGVYFLRILNENQSITKKLIIKK